MGARLTTDGQEGTFFGGVVVIELFHILIVADGYTRYGFVKPLRIVYSKGRILLYM
jgi:hypothetical protein